jgi:Glyoxalase-like domain
MLAAHPSIGTVTPHRHPDHRVGNEGGDAMGLEIAAVTFDCHDALVVGEFWSAVIGRPLDSQSTSDFASIGMPEHRDTEGWSLSRGDQPTWLFAKVPEPKTAKNRMHLDLAGADPEAEIARLVELGATRTVDMNEWGYEWTVLQDPEGNEFCVAQKR